MSNKSVAELAAEIMQAAVGNPNFRLDAGQIPAMIQQISAALNEAGSPNGVQVGPVAAAPAPFQVVEAPVALGEAIAETGALRSGTGRSPRQMIPSAAAAMQASSVVVSAAPEAGQYKASKIWPNLPKSVTDKFERIIEKHGLNRDEAGRPIPARRVDRLVSEDETRVADPITGQWFSILKHHIALDYDLTHQEMLAMFNLTGEQLPSTAPNYSRSKAEMAKQCGLGTRHRPDFAMGRGKQRISA